MVTHWESSRRSLYVRTVWKDGQHHVLLRREDEPQPRSATSFSRSRDIGSANYLATARKASSLSLSLAGVRSFKSSNTRQRRCKTSLQPQDNPGTPTFLQRDLRTLLKTSPRSKPTKNLNLTVKSHSVEIHIGKDPDEPAKCLSPYFSRRDLRRDNSLSERVMIWLDLATQGGDQVETHKQPVSNWQQLKNAVIKDKAITDYRLNVGFDRNKSEIASNGLGHAIESEKDQEYVSRERSVVVSERVAIVSEREAYEDEERSVLTSEEVEEAGQKCRAGPVKRQLHIFMPDLPKKLSDYESSILSSKVSGCSVKLRKSNSCRKI